MGSKAERKRRRSAHTITVCTGLANEGQALAPFEVNGLTLFDHLAPEHFDVIGMLIANGITPNAVERAANVLWEKMPSRMEEGIKGLVTAFNRYKISLFEEGVIPSLDIPQDMEIREQIELFIKANKDRLLEFSKEPSFVVKLLRAFDIIESNVLAPAGVVPRYGTIPPGIYDGRESDPLSDYSRRKYTLGDSLLCRKTGATRRATRPSLSRITFLPYGSDVRISVHPSVLAACLSNAYTDVVGWPPEGVVGNISKRLQDLSDSLLFGNDVGDVVHIAPYIRIKSGIPEITYSTHLKVPGVNGTFFVPFSGWVLDTLGVANIMDEIEVLTMKVMSTWFKLKPFSVKKIDRLTGKGYTESYLEVPMSIGGNMARKMQNLNNEQVECTVKVIRCLDTSVYYACQFPATETHAAVTYLITVSAGDTNYWYIPWYGNPEKKKSILSGVIRRMTSFVEGNRCVFEMGELPPIVGRVDAPNQWCQLKVAEYGTDVRILQVPLPKLSKRGVRVSGLNINKWRCPVISQEHIVDRAGNPAYTLLYEEANILGKLLIGSGTYVFAGSPVLADKLAAKLGATLYALTRVDYKGVNTDKVFWKRQDNVYIPENRDLLVVEDGNDIPFAVAWEAMLSSPNRLSCAPPENESDLVRAALCVNVIYNGYSIVV